MPARLLSSNLVAWLALSLRPACMVPTELQPASADADVDCSKLDKKQRELYPKCRTVTSLSDSSVVKQRLFPGDSIGIDDPGESRGEGPIPWDFMPTGLGAGPGVAVANPLASVVGVWDNSALQPGSDADSEPSLLVFGEDVGLGTAVQGIETDAGEAALLVSAPDGGFVAQVSAETSGSLDAEADADVVWTSSSGFALGEAIASGDFDGDGHLDLALTAADDGESGSVYIVAGPASGTVDVELEGTRIAGTEDLPATAKLGGVADMDGDGTDELWVGSPEATLDGGQGAVALLLGGGEWTTGDTDLEAADMVVVGTGGFGSSMATLTDQNNDGTSDLAVGAPDDSTRESLGGAVWLLDGDSVLAGGTASAEEVVVAIVFGEDPDAGLGASLALGGDSDGDGTAELLIGAEWAMDVDEVETGALYAVESFDVDGELEGTTYVGHQGHGWTGRAEGSRLGTVARGGVDIDGDGLAEVGATARGDSALEVVFGQ